MYTYHVYIYIILSYAYLCIHSGRQGVKPQLLWWPWPHDATARFWTWKWSSPILESRSQAWWKNVTRGLFIPIYPNQTPVIVHFHQWLWIIFVIIPVTFLVKGSKLDIWTYVFFMWWNSSLLLWTWDNPIPPKTSQFAGTIQNPKASVSSKKIRLRVGPSNNWFFSKHKELLQPRLF